MFFDNDKNTPATGSAFNSQQSAGGDGIPSFLTMNTESKSEQKSSYSFYKPNPYPKELVSVLKGMLQRLFPDTRKAFLLEAKQNDKKGYLLIVDIDAKFLKIINIYLDSETKRVRNDIPIECVLYSKSSAPLTEGVEPFYFREVSEQEEATADAKKEPARVVSEPVKELQPKPVEKPVAVSPAKKPAAEVPGKVASVDVSETRTNQTLKRTLSGVTAPKTNTKVKPSTKAELYGLLNEYGIKKTGTVSTVAMAALREFEFYIPFVTGEGGKGGEVVQSLPINDKLRFKTVVNPETEQRAVPLFTQKEDALSFVKKDNCYAVLMKYKDFSASTAFEITGHDGIVINPDDEGIFMLSTHPLLAETK